MTDALSLIFQSATGLRNVPDEAARALYRLVLALVACWLLSCQPSAAQSLRDDRIWLMSTRSASCSASLGEAANLEFWRCQPRGGWQSQSANQFLTVVNDPVHPLPLCIYVHENRVTSAEAFGRASQVYCQLQRAVPAAANQFRLLVVSWPSDRVGLLPRPDAQIKAKRSEAHGFYLAWLLDRIDPHVPVSLFGYSYGPRLITSALHLWGGGTIDGRALPRRGLAIRPPVRVALFAAALDSNWLAAGCHHGCALNQVDSMLIAYNPRDSVLRWYPRLFGRGGPQALGYVGLSRSNLAGAPVAVQQVNVSATVGKTHHWTAYSGSPAMMSRIGSFLIYQSELVD